MTTSRETVAQLVEHFHRNLSAYRSQGYNETQVRREFIDPFFEALGWDVANRAGYAEPYKDVIHEDAIKIGGATKAPDYCFRIGGTRKFFLEAKKPSVDVKADIAPAYQLRRYGWSAKLPLSILTDFEEFAVYDCRQRPKPTDGVATGRILYLTCGDYLDRFSEIYDVFARESVLRGSFDKFAESATGKRGTQEVDAAFLAEIEGWREALARNLALRNPSLSVRDLNFAVQVTIDRIIFLRMCEDRGIEPYSQLQGLLNGGQVYSRLVDILHQADDKYNSGLFDFKADALTPSLAIDDKVLKDLFARLYYPESPYEFSVLGADILGNVYEQFLGKVIRLTAGHQAKVEEKPEVKKAGGVYYTPRYIVDYIVKQTVGKLLEGDRGSGIRGRETGKGDDARGDTDVSGLGDVAEEHGLGGGGLSPDQAAAQGRAVRADQPVAAGGNVSSGKHRGRPRKTAPGRLSAVPVHREGIADGSRDPYPDSSAAGILAAGAGRHSVESASGNRPSTEWPHPVFDKPVTTRKRKPKVPTPGPRSPTPGPRPLTPKDVSKLRILDPACGSGSFLLAAYQYLLDWHRDWYVNDGPEKHTDAIYQVATSSPDPRSRPPCGRQAPDTWRLTTREKKRILLNNLYGVDIDSQAVEVTKLSLLLKVLEGENKDTLESQLSLWRERALPDLGNNIKCGNSLIGPDFYSQQTLALDEEEMYRINAFDWEREFPEIMKAGGFDAVIGNPPWGAEFHEGDRLYIVRRYPRIPTKTKDSYMYFIDKSIGLLRIAGRLGLIVPNTWLLINSAVDFRRNLLLWDVEEIIDRGDGVFKQATVESCTFILVKAKRASSCRAVRMRKGVTIIDHSVDKGVWLEDDHSRVILDADLQTNQLLKKLRAHSTPFERDCSIIWGIKPYQVGYGDPPQTREMVDQRVYHSARKEGPEWKPLLVGRDVDRYRKSFSGNQFIRYGKWLMYSSNETFLLQPKILMRQTSDTLRACFDDERYYCQNSVFVIHSSRVDLKYLLGLLNSHLLGFVYKHGNPQTGKVFAEIKPSVIRQLPIRPIDFSSPSDVAKHDRMVEMVERMLDLHKRLAPAQTPHDKELLQRQIAATDQQIDRLVYELYELTEEEIGIVEGRL